MFIVYHYNETIAAVSTLEEASRIRDKIGDNVKIVFEKV